MRLLSWNVARRVAGLGDQANAVLDRGADLVALQEITATTLPEWRERLGEEYARIVCSLDRAPLDRLPAGPRRHGVLVASRWPLGSVAAPELPWAEVAVPAVVRAPGLRFELLAVHVPNSRNGFVKVETLEGLWAWLARRGRRPRILCGDLNTPRSERRDGTVLTFARDQYGRLRPERGERWDAAELALVTDIDRLGMLDVFRSLHGLERKEISWGWPRYPRSGYRLDHVIASSELRPVKAEYLNELRLAGLSDHAPIEVDFDR